MNFGKRATANKQKKITSKKSLFAGKLKVIVLRLLIVAVIAALGGAIYMGVNIVKGVISDAPSITAADVKPSGYTTFVYDQNGKELEKFVEANANRVWKGIDEIPEVTQKAFVAIEDSRFYEHNGIDLQGIARAAVKGITSGHFSEGASTITQQLIKNTVYPDFVNEETFKESLIRKIQEQYLAVKLEQTMSKGEIMENYLNTINLGQNSLGIQTASKRYFGKDCSELTLSESAVIASITQNPSKYNPISHPEDNAKRRDKVLGDMLEQGWITQEEYDEALADDVYERIQTTNAAIQEESDSAVYSYYVDELISQVIQDLQDMKGYSYTQAYNALYSGGLSIYACQDEEIQAIVDEEMDNPNNFPYEVYWGISYAATVTRVNGDIENFYDETLLQHMKEKYGDGYSLLFNSPEEAYACAEEYEQDILTPGDSIIKNVSVTPEPQASVVIMDQYTGEVKAISGGRGEKAGSLTLNRATDTTRQPGSCFKVLAAYAPAMDACGYTLATTITDEEFFYDSGQQVRNWWGTNMYYGDVTVRKAIEQSMNVCAVKTLTDITPQLGFNYLQKFGFTTIVDRLELADGTVLSDIVQPMALGGITNGITNLEITAAYASLANKGVYTKPRFYSKILDHEGNVLIDNTPQTHQVVQETTAALLTNAMQDVINQGTGTTARLSNMPVSGKTGTTQDNGDIWLCAYTPYYCCSVWGGFDQNQSMANTTWHMVLWRSIMQRIHADLEYKEFEMPESCHQQGVCRATGMIAGQYCDQLYEWFAEGTGPDGYCTGLHGYNPEEDEDEDEDKDKDDDNDSGDSDDSGDSGEETPPEPEETTLDDGGGDAGGGDTGGDDGGGDAGGGEDAGGGGDAGGGDTGGGDDGGGDVIIE